MERYLITGVAYAACGLLVSLLAAFLFRIRLSGRIAAATIVSVVAAFLGGIVDNLLLDSFPDLIVLGGVVDIGPALIAALVFQAVFVASAGAAEA